MSQHSYACSTLRGLFPESARVTQPVALWMSRFYPQNDNLTEAHSSEWAERMTGFVPPPLSLSLSSQGSSSTPSWCRVWIEPSSATGSSISKLLMCPFSALRLPSMTSSTPRRTKRWGRTLAFNSAAGDQSWDITKHTYFGYILVSQNVESAYFRYLLFSEV